MLGKTWLLLDVNYLAYRGFYSTGSPKTDYDPTGTVYRVLEAVRILQEDHDTRDIVFCFDYGLNKRLALCPEYKAGRHKSKTPEEQELFEQFQVAVTNLREKYLPRLGFSNVLYSDGFEADDVIASFVKNTLPTTDEIVIVSSDHDLYQLLYPHVCIWNPTKKTAYRRKNFIDEWGISPARWPHAKALAGCSTDNVIGIEGVGEATAVKYLRNELIKGKVFDRIIKQGQEIHDKNIRLVSLPFEGCPTFTLAADTVTDAKWKKLLEHLEFTELLRG